VGRLRVVLLLAVLAVCRVGVAGGADVSSSTASDTLHAATTPAGFPVQLEGREIFRVQAGIKANTAEARARGLSERLLRIARDRSIRFDSLSVTDTDISTDVSLGDRMLFSVFDSDAVMAGRDRVALARDRANEVTEAVLDYRVRYAARSLIMGAVWALLATLAYIAILTLLSRLLRRTIAAIDAWVGSKSENIRRKSKEFLPPEAVQTGLRSLARFVRWVLVLVASYIYVNLLLGFFPWTQRLSGTLLGLLIQPLRVMGSAVLAHLPGLIFIGILAYVTRAVLKFGNFVAQEVEQGRVRFSGFYPEWAKPTFNIVRILIVLFAVVVAYPYIPGSDTEAFKGVSIFVGVLFSLGSTSAVSNIVAGIILTYMRAFRVGEIVQVGGERGMVTEMSLLAIHVRTPKNVEVTIPNATVLASQVTNFSALAKETGLILHTTVGIGYDAPWRQVHAMLLAAAAKTNGVKTSPAPFVLQTALADMCVNYELNAYVDSPERMLRIYSELHKNIQDQFNEYGVQILTPSFEGEPKEPALVPKEKWYAAPAKQPGEPGADE
jgi:small-conductance mechanosensitive channel